MKRFIEEYPILAGMIIGLVVFVVAALVLGCVAGQSAGANSSIAVRKLVDDSASGVVCYGDVQVSTIACTRTR